MCDKVSDITTCNTETKLQENRQVQWQSFNLYCRQKDIVYKSFHIVVKGGQQQEAGGKEKITVVITFN